MSKPARPRMKAPRPMQSPSASDVPFIPPMGREMEAHGGVEEDEDEDALDDEDDEKDVLLDLTPGGPNDATPGGPVPQQQQVEVEVETDPWEDWQPTNEE